MLKSSTLILSFLFATQIFGQVLGVLEQKGDRLSQKSKYSDALIYYLDAYVEEPNYRITKKIANTHFTLQNFQKAANWNFKLLQFNKQKVEDYQSYIKCLLKSNQEDKALEFTELLNQFYPEKQDSLLLFTTWVKQKISSPCYPDISKKQKVLYCTDIDATPSKDPNNPNTYFVWETEEGKIYKGDRVELCFKRAGDHRVRLMIVDTTYGQKQISDTTITLSFMQNAYFILTGPRIIESPISVSALNLTRDANYYGMVWEFGDGEISLDPSTKYSYKKAGFYDIKLTVFGQTNQRDIYTIGCLTKNWTTSKR